MPIHYRGTNAAVRFAGRQPAAWPLPVALGVLLVLASVVVGGW